MSKMHLSTVDAFKHIHTQDCVTLDDEQLKCLQRVLNSILDDIVTVCEDNQIRYTLGGGSALGAVRHHGFIPWDDDIDLNMPREDYNRFIPVFRRRFGEKYWIHTPQETVNYDLLLSRIRLKGTSVCTREDFGNTENGAFVDLFVIENTFDNALLRTIHGIGCNGLGFLVSCRKFYRDRKPLMMLARDTGDRRLQAVFRFKIALGFLIAWIPIESWLHAGDRWNALCKNRNSEYVVVPTGRKHFWGEMYRREDICEGTDVLYDGKMRKCPAGTDLYLTRLYGNYMQLPDPEDIEKHVFFAPFDLGSETADWRQK